MVISFCGPIGSFGKTISCLNLGAALIGKGKKVLYIDLDFVSDLTRFFTEPDGNKYTVFDVFAKGENIDQAIYHSTERNCDYIPAETDMHFMSIYYQLSRLDGGYLKSEIERIHEQYDYILIDCTQGADIYQIAGVLSSKVVIIPAYPENYSLYEEYDDRVRLLIEKSDVNEKIDRRLLLNAVGERKCMEHLNSLETDTRVFKTVIPRDDCFEILYCDRKKDMVDEFPDNIKSAYVELVEEIEGLQK